MALDIGSIAVPMVLSLITTTIVMIIVSKKYLVPLLSTLIDTKTQDAQNMMKAAASTLGQKSGEARQIKKMENMMFDDILEQFPELEIALEYFSPDTAELIRKHPQRAMTIIMRYKPILDGLMGKVQEDKEGYQY